MRRQQWLALVLLTAGVGLVQLYEAGGVAGAAAAGAASGGLSGAVAVGVAAVLASSLLSGFANVYFEKVRAAPPLPPWLPVPPPCRCLAAAALPPRRPVHLASPRHAAPRGPTARAHARHRATAPPRHRAIAPPRR
jgi:drug/metabolite transporter (DMT)-like permease